jgi:hypothetical protein
LDPIFRTNDGSNCANVDTSTVAARRVAFSLLLNKGLIRVGMQLPAGAEFTVVRIEDPYGCAASGQISAYRRPLPSTNLRFLSTVMWDGRETFTGNSITDDLMHQAMDATVGHAQASHPPDAETLRRIVSFETGLYTAQISDNAAGRLNADGGRGGPVALSVQPFHLGINDPLGQDPSGAPFSPEAFNLYRSWMEQAVAGISEARAAIARGERLFNTKPIAIAGVAGLNDKIGQRVLAGTCTTCHNTPNSGNHSLPLPINIGVADRSRRTPDLPLYTLRCDATGAEIETTDPGRALVTGKCEDIGKFKGPVLRALAARAPYFHNGSARTLEEVLDFYESRFGLVLSTRERADLVAFLRSL